jgi:hypothetical protein
LVLMAALGRALVGVFLTARHRRLHLKPHLEDGAYRLGRRYAPRRLKTAYGSVPYGRAHLIPRHGGSGFYPLDALLGFNVSPSRFSPTAPSTCPRQHERKCKISSCTQMK